MCWYLVFLVLFCNLDGKLGNMQLASLGLFWHQPATNPSFILFPFMWCAELNDTRSNPSIPWDSFPRLHQVSSYTFPLFFCISIMASAYWTMITCQLCLCSAPVCDGKTLSSQYRVSHCSEHSRQLHVFVIQMCVSTPKPSVILQFSMDTDQVFHKFN